jgi:hypothetical protein
VDFPCIRMHVTNYITPTISGLRVDLFEDPDDVKPQRVGHRKTPPGA